MPGGKRDQMRESLERDAVTVADELRNSLFECYERSDSAYSSIRRTVSSGPRGGSQ